MSVYFDNSVAFCQYEVHLIAGTPIVNALMNASKPLLKTCLIALITVAVSYPTVAQDTPPAEGKALFQWLKSGGYKNWIHESSPHKSAGPHPSAVIAYLNESLNESLNSGADKHPAGAAAVKELFNTSGELSGWAVSIKTQEDSDAGKGWYWYEILGTEESSRVVADGNGVPLCVRCHTPGNDFVLIPHPLK